MRWLDDARRAMRQDTQVLNFREAKAACERGTGAAELWNNLIQGHRQVTPDLASCDRINGERAEWGIWLGAANALVAHDDGG